LKKLSKLGVETHSLWSYWEITTRGEKSQWKGSTSVYQLCVSVCVFLVFRMVNETSSEARYWPAVQTAGPVYTDYENGFQLGLSHKIRRNWSERSACAALGCWHKRRWPL
jgi:hypothetical protein